MKATEEKSSNQIRNSVVRTPESGFRIRNKTLWIQITALYFFILFGFRNRIAGDFTVAIMLSGFITTVSVILDDFVVSNDVCFRGAILLLSFKDVCFVGIKN